MTARLRIALLMALTPLAALAPVAGARADVISSKPEAVAVTVYRDHTVSAEQLRQAGDSDDTDTSGLAFISETRTVDLPAGRTRIDFQGVADAIIPASAALEGLPGRLVERNFDYDLLDPGSLIEHAVAGQVSIRRTNPKTGQVTEEPATLRSGPDGVVVQTAAGVEALGCGTGPQALIFSQLPEGLSDKPTLSVIADAPAAGRYKLTLSYLAVRIDWSADYVARIAPDGQTLDLTGWLTLSNRSGASFGDAPTSVVAGQLARVTPDLPDISAKQVTSECWPMGTTSDVQVRPPAPAPPVVREEPLQQAPIAITAFSSAQRDMVGFNAVRAVMSSLGDYKLYTLAEPTTLAARQTKQIRFLTQPHVQFERLYVLNAAPGDDLGEDEFRPAAVILSLENKTTNGLGLPLPAGEVSLRQPQAGAGGREFFLGAPTVRDVPVGEPFELKVGQASDVQVAAHTISDTKVGAGHNARRRQALAFTITNAKPTPVTFELRAPSDTDSLKIIAESQRHVLKNGALTWRVIVPANGSAVLDVTTDTPA